MRFHTLIGVLPHEVEVPQPVEIDLTVWQADARFSIDYRDLYRMAADALAPGHGPYLEDVAAHLAKSVMCLDAVSGVRVAVRKPHVALPGPLEYAEVVVEQSNRG